MNDGPGGDPLSSPPRPQALAALCAGVLGASGVALGAFAAHALSNTLEASLIAVIETSVRYQMLHALALLALAAAPPSLFPPAQLRMLVQGFMAGAVVFCGSLDLMVLTGWHRLGIITPLGGVILIGTWIALAWFGWRRLR